MPFIGLTFSFFCLYGLAAELGVRLPSPLASVGRGLRRLFSVLVADIRREQKLGVRPTCFADHKSHPGLPAAALDQQHRHSDTATFQSVARLSLSNFSSRRLCQAQIRRLLALWRARNVCEVFRSFEYYGLPSQMELFGAFVKSVIK